MRNNEKGRSMIEMLGVLAIVGVLSVGGLAGYSKAMIKYKTTKLINEVSEIVMNTRTLYMNQESLEGLTMDILVRSSAIPHNMIQGNVESSYAVKHAFGGSVSVFPSLDNDGIEHAFELYINDINNISCMTLASMDWGQDVASGFIGMYLGTVPIQEPKMRELKSGDPSNLNQLIFTPGPHENSIPLSIINAQAGCQCEGTTCTIGLKYM